MGEGAGDGGANGLSQGVKPGALTALLKELVAPAEELQGIWKTLRPGMVLGRFELLRELGRGGFGVVFEARDQELGRSVAFKLIRAHRSEADADKLHREAEVVARLQHPNLVTLHDVGRCEEGPYLVLELLRGETLQARLSQGPLPLREALVVAVEVARGLAYAHAEGVVHRDLKPSNVFLCERGGVKLLDFGMAHAFGHKRVSGGTPAYMAPEQWSDSPEDERTDVFALGVMLYQMLTGTLPFPDDGGKSARGPEPAPQLQVPSAPALGPLVARMLTKDPAARTRDGGAALAELERIAAELPNDAPATAAPVVVRRPSIRRWRITAFPDVVRPVRRGRGFPFRVAAVVAIGLVAVLAAATALVLHRRPAPAASPIIRVAVLPFANLSGDPTQEYLGDGIAQEIARRLTSVVPVVGGSSLERYKHANPGAQAIGRELGVAFIVEGGVRRAAQRIRVNASVVRAIDSRQMWSDEIDVPFDQVLEMQERVASRVVHAFGITLGPEEHRLLGPRGTRSTEAYDEYLQGEFAFYSVEDPLNDQEARLHLERALALDPAYAPALGLLAWVEVNAYRNYAGGPEHLDRAESLLKRALSIDPHLGIARNADGYLRGSRFDYQGAAAELDELVRDQPLSWEAWDQLCWALGYAWPRPLAEAERACLRSLELNPSNAGTHYHLVRALAPQGKHAEAEKAQQQVERLAAGSDLVPWGRFVIAMEEGRPRDALVAWPTTRRTDNKTMAWQAAALAQAGQIEAFARLEKALDAGYRDAADLRNSPWYEPLRKDPRFEKLLSKHGLGP